MAVGFLVLFIILAVISIAMVVTMETLVKPWKINRTYLIYAVSLGCYMLYLTFLCAYYDNIKRSGIATEGLMVTARLFQHASYAVFVLLLILLSRGYKITRYEFDRVHWLQYGVSSAIYTAIYFSVLLYVIATFDKEVYLYILDYPGSDGILIMRVIAWVWFFVVTIITFCQHVKTRLFYFFYFVLYSGWFLGVPLFVWICRHTATLELTRESLVFGVDHTLNLLAMILYLTIVVFVFERKETPDKFNSPEGMTGLGVAEMAACDTDRDVTATASE
ncbi:transmembrane protein 145-like [Ptychodera flava]|uniref:transmembrane protein 145-like n=1 Tax=Ptychodera flava TaxID=63121 RepID=UPI00396A1C6F